MLSQPTQSQRKEVVGEMLRMRDERVARFVPTDEGVRANCPLPCRSGLRGLPVWKMLEFLERSIQAQNPAQQAIPQFERGGGNSTPVAVDQRNACEADAKRAPSSSRQGLSKVHVYLPTDALYLLGMIYDT